MTTMTAVRMHAYGDADVLHVDDVARPGPVGPSEIRVAVKAAAINPVDHKIRSGAQRALIWLKLPYTLGMDVSGVVVEKGSRVTDFEVGDAVISSPSHRRMGCYAEEVVLSADECAKKPSSIDHVQAAALPLVGLTAWDALVGACDLREGEKVLIQAGSGGVGSIAIQLAKHLGATVYTTCSARNAELVRELGADRVIDYNEERYEDVAAGCDVILESMGSDHVERAMKTVGRGGRIASITPGMMDWTKRHGAVLGVLMFVFHFIGQWWRARFTHGARLALVTRKASGKNLAKLAELVDAGAIKPLVDRTFPLQEVREAHRYLETGRARGKVVLTVAS